MLGDEPGYARTLLFVGEGKDVPGAYSRDDVVAAIKQHHAIVTNAPFIDMKIGGAIPGDQISLPGAISIAVHVSAPSWAPVNHLTIYANSKVISDQAIPTGTDFTTSIPFTPTADAWVVAEVSGVSNMFPVNSPTEFPPLDVSAIITALSSGIDLSSLPITSNLKPQKLHFSKPYAITNPIWIDTNSDGQFTPPKAPFANQKAPGTGTPPATHPDVRAQFDSLPEVSP